MSYRLDVLAIVNQAEFVDRWVHSILITFHNFSLIIHEAIDLHNLDVEVKGRDQLFSNLSADELGWVVEDYVGVLRLPFLHNIWGTLDLFILICAEKYSYACSEAIVSNSDSFSTKNAL